MSLTIDPEDTSATVVAAETIDMPWHPTRGSRRSRTVNGSIGRALPVMSSGFGLRALGLSTDGLALTPSPAMIRRARPLVNQAICRLSPVPRGTRVTPVHHKRGLRGEWVSGRDVGPSGTVIYYLHGSGYAVCSPRTHRGFVSRLSTLTGLPAFSLDYRLGPEYTFPTAGDDAIAGYQWLLDRGYSANQIIVAGDSAGGHLAIDLIAHNHRTGTPQPRAMTLFSPLSDPTFSLALARQRGGHRDPLIDARLGAHVLGLYLGDVERNDPRLIPELTADMELPPTLIQAGSLEVMADDARDIHSRLSAAGGRSDLQIWPDQTHVFQLFPMLAPEAGRATRAAAGFITDQLDAARRVTGSH
ncbi:alpha/beta hydrolase [Williamsia deligens]|uniref:Alpha/beta hydrolase n=1 Tax=Williamsia deligens TaxID=321325 RepID=A0ABW3G479_9NOCA|nr:alpha/beta hydrolase [Williamsia deligens]MCP2193883.1 Acetyl esterase/lipase [Williamsia deligens]